MLDLKKVKESLAEVKRNPRKWVPLLILLVFIAFGGMWFSGFLGEKGKQAAERPAAVRPTDTDELRTTPPPDGRLTIGDRPEKGKGSSHTAAPREEDESHSDRHERDEATAANGHTELHGPKQYVPEDSAGAIFESLGGIKPEIGGHRKFAARVEELFVGRWVKEPGWKGTVEELAERFYKDTWLVKVREDGNTAESVVFLLAYTTDAKAADFRVGDTVAVTGQIKNVSRVVLGIITLNPATVSPR